jgi:hypothetical protein
MATSHAALRSACSTWAVSAPRFSTKSRHKSMPPLTSSIKLSRPKAVKRILPAAIPATIETAISINIQMILTTSICIPERKCAARPVSIIKLTTLSANVRGPITVPRFVRHRWAGKFVPKTRPSQLYNGCSRAPGLVSMITAEFPLHRLTRVATMDQRPSFSTDSIAGIVLLPNKTQFHTQIRPKNSVSPPCTSRWQHKLGQVPSGTIITLAFMRWRKLPITVPWMRSETPACP